MSTYNCKGLASVCFREHSYPLACLDGLYLNSDFFVCVDLSQKNTSLYKCVVLFGITTWASQFYSKYYSKRNVFLNIETQKILFGWQLCSEFRFTP